MIEECAPSHDTVCKNGGYRQPTKRTDNEPLQKVKTSQAPMTKPGTSLERGSKYHEQVITFMYVMREVVSSTLAGPTLRVFK